MTRATAPGLPGIADDARTLFEIAWRDARPWTHDATVDAFIAGYAERLDALHPGAGTAFGWRLAQRTDDRYEFFLTYINRTIGDRK